MMLHEDDIRISSNASDPRAFGTIKRKTVVININSGSSVELKRGLTCPDQWVALGHGKRRCIGHMGVKRDLGSWQ